MTQSQLAGRTTRRQRILDSSAGEAAVVIVVWLLIPVWMILVITFGPHYLIGVFIWWLIRSAINWRYRKVTPMAYRTATKTECVRCTEGMPVVLVYREDYKKRLCDVHRETFTRIQSKEARILDGEQ